MHRRLLQVTLLILLAAPLLAASGSFDSLGHRLVCQCGCGQILLDCNHVGCPVSGPMMQELRAQMAAQAAAGLPGSSVLNWFVGKYGPIVLAAPIRGGFDTVAWIVPFAVLILALVGVVFLVRLWHARHARLAPALPLMTASPLEDDLRDRIRRDTEPRF